MGSQDRGLTLIEVIVTLALLGMALGAIAGMTRATFRSMLLTERTL